MRLSALNVAVLCVVVILVLNVVQRQRSRDALQKALKDDAATGGWDTLNLGNIPLEG